MGGRFVHNFGETIGTCTNQYRGFWYGCLPSGGIAIVLRSKVIAWRRREGYHHGRRWVRPVGEMDVPLRDAEGRFEVEGVVSVGIVAVVRSVSCRRDVAHAREAQ